MEIIKIFADSQDPALTMNMPGKSRAIEDSASALRKIWRARSRISRKTESRLALIASHMDKNYIDGRSTLFPSPTFQLRRAFRAIFPRKNDLRLQSQPTSLAPDRCD